MKRLVALALGMAVMVGVAVAPASAGQFGSQVSVFPTYRDPWASWGRHPHTTVVVPAPGVVAVTRGVVGTPVVAQPLWFPDQWAWNGFGWVWIPGHWGF